MAYKRRRLFGIKVAVMRYGARFRWQVSISGSLIKSGTCSSRQFARTAGDVVAEQVEALEIQKHGVPVPRDCHVQQKAKRVEALVK